MARTGEKDAVLSRKYGQLLRMQERLMVDLERARGELESPITGKLLRDVQRSGSTIAEFLSQATAAVEEALRAVQVCQSEIRRELTTSSDEFTVDGISNLPPVLAHFLAERIDLPGFHYEILQDPIRGWIIRWKEFTGQGTVRGHGQFYERPYAWLTE
jgi:hypothetical protein